MRTILLLLIFPLIVSCQEKFNGKNEETFKQSREKIETALNQYEKTTLEKALRVIAMEAMYLKWNEPNYKEQILDDISLQLIDGLSYSSTINLAETFLKKNKHNKIEATEEKIEKRTKEIKDFEDIQTKLKLFMISDISINKQDFFDEEVLMFTVLCDYIGRNETIGEISIRYTIKQKSSNQILESITYSSGTPASITNSKDSRNGNIIVRNSSNLSPKLWSASSFPISNPNLSDYDLELQIEVTKISTNEEIIELPKIEDINETRSEIERLNEELKELKSTKGTLDELELE